MKSDAVDWVELGCRGWYLEETGAGLYGLRAGECHGSGSWGLPDVGDEWGHCHIDLRTLDIQMGGLPAFIQRANGDLLAAEVLRIDFPWAVYPTDTGSPFVTYTWAPCTP